MIGQIIYNKHLKLDEINRVASKEIQKIIREKFDDFDKIEVSCHSYEDTVKLTKNGRVAIFNIHSCTYGNGSHVRKYKGGALDFTKTEVNDIIRRLNELFQD